MMSIVVGFHDEEVSYISNSKCIYINCLKYIIYTLDGRPSFDHAYSTIYAAHDLFTESPNTPQNTFHRPRAKRMPLISVTMISSVYAHLALEVLPSILALLSDLSAILRQRLAMMSRLPPGLEGK